MVSRPDELESLDALEVAAALELRPHREGGFFRETYRSSVIVPTPVGARSLCTSILYLLTADNPSLFHRLRFDEVWFFHGGSPAEMVFLDPLESRIIGPEEPQALAPGGRWMAARVAPRARQEHLAGVASGLPGGSSGSPRPGVPWTLVGCVVSPGFEYDDFEAGDRESLLRAYAAPEELIRALT